MADAREGRRRAIRQEGRTYGNSQAGGPVSWPPSWSLWAYA